MPTSFLERLQGPPILSDGAMGTELYARGASTFERCLDELNLTAPDVVRAVHLDYIRAGPEVIETNTFGANSLRLAGYGLEEKEEEINRRGRSHRPGGSTADGADGVGGGGHGPGWEAAYPDAGPRDAGAGPRSLPPAGGNPVRRGSGPAHSGDVPGPGGDAGGGAGRPRGVPAAHRGPDDAH